MQNSNKQLNLAASSRTSDALILKSCQRTIAELTEAISNRLVASNNDNSHWSKLGTQLAEVQNRASLLSER